MLRATAIADTSVAVGRTPERKVYASNGPFNPKAHGAKRTGWITFLTKTLNVIFQLGWECPTASNANSATPPAVVPILVARMIRGSGLGA